jgi:radical SAM enzyme (TIGR01210 family)
MNSDFSPLSDAQIVAARGAKRSVDPTRPYAYLVEPERSAAGNVVPVATLFLTNRECPFRCLMCDLWQNTTDDTVPVGAIPAQIDFALARLPPARHLKLYNSGNFFDPQAIPPADYPPIAARCEPFERVIVENHPRLCTPRCLEFRDQVAGQLEVAVGLETVHPAALAALNKRMTVADFDRAAEFLAEQAIDLRVFLLLRPPLLSEQEGIDWALVSLEHAFARGATCCSVIPTRAGNGMMERLEQQGWFAPPKLASLETVLEQGIALGKGRVFVDLWDAANLATCQHCAPDRLERLRQMNLSQTILPPISCACREPA